MRGQLYHGHYLIISPLHGHGEVANENPLILPRTLSIVGALVLLKRRAGKKNASSAFRLAQIYILSGCKGLNGNDQDAVSADWGKTSPVSSLLVTKLVNYNLFSL